MSDDITNFQNLLPEINNSFQYSDLYDSFGLVNITKNDYAYSVVLIISASDDIEVPRVVDFLKDFVPTQMDEAENLPILERFKTVNAKISEILADTLEENSFIDVQIGYVLFKESYFYVSLDKDYDLIVARGENNFNLRRGSQNTIDGSGIFKNGDAISLNYGEVTVIAWPSVVELPRISPEDKNFTSKNTVAHTHETEDGIDIKKYSSIDESEVVAKDSSNLSDNIKEDEENIELDNDENEREIDQDSGDEEENDTPRIKKDSKFVSTFASVKNNASSFAKKAAPIASKHSKNILKSLADAFSYIFSIIFRSKTRSLGRTLPHKKKGFLVIIILVFCIILLFFVVKSINEDNARKQADTAYQAQISSVQSDVDAAVTTNNKVTFGDPVLQAKIIQLQNELVNLQKSSLKDKFLSEDKIKDLNNKINSLQDLVDYVSRVDQSSILTLLQGIQKNANPVDMTLRDDKIYYIDATNIKVVQVDVTTGVTTDILTADSGISKPVSLQFSKTKLLLLDQANGIFDIDIVNKKVKKLASYDTVAAASTRIDTYYDTTTDNFYLLSPTKNLIYRVPGAGNGTFAVSGRYNPTDFTDTKQDFTIVDGKILTIDTTGQINRYNRVSGSQVNSENFTLPTLDVPLGAGARIVGMKPRDIGNVYLFVSDPTNNRILVFDSKDPGGNLILKTQYKPKSGEAFDFHSIQSIRFDEKSDKILLYVISSYALFKIILSPSS